MWARRRHAESGRSILRLDGKGAVPGDCPKNADNSTWWDGADTAMSNRIRPTAEWNVGYDELKGSGCLSVFGAFLI